MEVLDKEKLEYNYSVIEGDVLSDKYEKITYETRLEATKGGGTLIRGWSKYVTKGDHKVDEEDVKANRKQAHGLLQAVEVYLLENPQLYN